MADVDHLLPLLEDQLRAHFVMDGSHGKSVDDKVQEVRRAIQAALPCTMGPLRKRENVFAVAARARAKLESAFMLAQGTPAGFSTAIREADLLAERVLQTLQTIESSPPKDDYAHSPKHFESPGHHDQYVQMRADELAIQIRTLEASAREFSGTVDVQSITYIGARATHLKVSAEEHNRQNGLVVTVQPCKVVRPHGAQTAYVDRKRSGHVAQTTAVAKKSQHVTWVTHTDIPVDTEEHAVVFTISRVRVTRPKKVIGCAVLTLHALRRWNYSTRDLPIVRPGPHPRRRRGRVLRVVAKLDYSGELARTATAGPPPPPVLHDRHVQMVALASALVKVSPSNALDADAVWLLEEFALRHHVCPSFVACCGTAVLAANFKAGQFMLDSATEFVSRLNDTVPGGRPLCGSMHERSWARCSRRLLAAHVASFLSDPPSGGIAAADAIAAAVRLAMALRVDGSTASSSSWEADSSDWGDTALSDDSLLEYYTAGVKRRVERCVLRATQHAKGGGPLLVTKLCALATRMMDEDGVVAAKMPSQFDARSVVALEYGTVVTRKCAEALGAMHLVRTEVMQTAVHAMSGFSAASTDLVQSGGHVDIATVLMAAIPRWLGQLRITVQQNMDENQQLDDFISATGRVSDSATLRMFTEAASQHALMAALPACDHVGNPDEPCFRAEFWQVLCSSVHAYSVYVKNECNEEVQFALATMRNAADAEGEQSKDDLERVVNQTYTFKSSLAKGVVLGVGGIVQQSVMGVAGIFAEPVKGAQNAGASGFFRGVAKGVAGVVLKPLGAGVKLVSGTVGGVANDISHMFGLTGDATDAILPPELLTVTTRFYLGCLQRLRVLLDQHTQSNCRRTLSTVNRVIANMANVQHLTFEAAFQPVRAFLGQSFVFVVWHEGVKEEEVAGMVEKAISPVIGYVAQLHMQTDAVLSAALTNMLWCRVVGVLIDAFLIGDPRAMGSRFASGRTTMLLETLYDLFSAPVEPAGDEVGLRGIEEEEEEEEEESELDKYLNAPVDAAAGDGDGDDDDAGHGNAIPSHRIRKGGPSLLKGRIIGGGLQHETMHKDYTLLTHLIELSEQPTSDLITLCNTLRDTCQRDNFVTDSLLIRLLAKRESDPRAQHYAKSKGSDAKDWASILHFDQEKEKPIYSVQCNDGDSRRGQLMLTSSHLSFLWESTMLKGASSTSDDNHNVVLPLSDIISVQQWKGAMGRRHGIVIRGRQRPEHTSDILILQVLEATHIISVQAEATAGRPFVRVRIGATEDSTEPASDVRDPVWRAPFKFDVKHGEKRPVEFKILFADKKKKSAGRAVLNISEMFSGASRTIDTWLPLSNNDQGGRLHVQATLTETQDQPVTKADVPVTKHIFDLQTAAFVSEMWSHFKGLPKEIKLPLKGDAPTLKVSKGARVGARADDTGVDDGHEMGTDHEEIIVASADWADPKRIRKFQEEHGLFDDEMPLDTWSCCDAERVLVRGQLTVTDSKIIFVAKPIVGAKAVHILDMRELEIVRKHARVGGLVDTALKITMKSNDSYKFVKFLTAGSRNMCYKVIVNQATKHGYIDLP